MKLKKENSMKINNKKLENAIVELTVAFDSEEWKATQEKALDKLAKNVKIDGFRPGKAPAAMVRARVSKASVLEEATDMILQTKFVEILTEANVEPVAQPALSVQKVDADELEVQILVPVKPQVELGEYKGLEVKKGRVTVTKKEIEEQLANYQTQFAELTVKEGGKVAKGDTAVIDFEGFVDGVAFEGGKGENYPLEIGSGSFIPGFEDQVIGMTVDKEQDIVVTFPEDYDDSSIAGKKCELAVSINMIEKEVIPEVNDALVKENTDCKTVKEYKKQVRDSLVSDKKSEAEQTNQETLWNKIMDNATQLKDFSEADIKKEVSNIKIENKEMAGYFGMSVSDFIEQYYEMSLEDYAKENLKKQCVQDLLLKENSIEITDADVDEEIQYYIDELGYKDKKEVLSAISEDEIHSELQYTKLMDALMKETTIK